MQHWLAHGSQFLRCAPHHVRPDYNTAADTAVGDVAAARKAVAELKSRGVTRFLDLNKANKRNYDEVNSDDEAMDDDGGDGQPPRLRARLEPFTPSTPVPHAEGLDLELTDGIEDPASPRAPSQAPSNSYEPTTPAESIHGLPVEESPNDETPTMPPPTVPTLPMTSPTLPVSNGDEPEPSGEPSAPPSVRAA